MSLLSVCLFWMMHSLSSAGSVQVPWKEFLPRAPEVGRSGLSCHELQDGRKRCLKAHPNQNLKLMEIYPDASSVIPEQAMYFRKDGSLLADWNQASKTILVLDSRGGLRQKLSKGIYKRFDERGAVILECESNTCSHSRFNPLSPPRDLQPGDILFTGNLSRYTRLESMPLSHVSIVHSKTQSGVLLVQNDMFAPLEIETLQETMIQSVAYAVLRDARFTSEFLRIRPSLFAKSLKVPYFCGNMLQEIVRRQYPDIHSEWDEIDKNYAELLYLNLAQHFSVVGFAIPGYTDISKYRQQRMRQMPQIRRTIRSIHESPDLFHALFAHDFALQPIGVSTHLLQNLHTWVQLYSP